MKEDNMNDFPTPERIDGAEPIPNGAFAPLLTTTDWNEEWKRLQVAREHSDSAAVWDEKAKTFPVKHGSHEGYVGEFLRLADVKPGETVLDMGCGTGALATPLAQEGCHVIACDFSQGMLDMMREDQREHGVEGVDCRLMSWNDNWEAHGLGEDSVDVALASRSIATYDLQEALLKLNRVARRRVCVTLSSGPSPRCDARLLEAAGFSNRLGTDFLYAFNILAANGIEPEVAYIPNTRREQFATFEEALETFASIALSAMRGFAPQSELDCIPERLRTWLQQSLIEDDRGFHLEREREVTWAFISWNKR